MVNNGSSDRVHGSTDGRVEDIWLYAKTLFDSFIIYANHFLMSRNYFNSLLIIKFLTFRRYLCIVTFFHSSFRIAILIFENLRFM